VGVPGTDVFGFGFVNVAVQIGPEYFYQIAHAMMRANAQEATKAFNEAMSDANSN
jgi:hypothetical protein